MRFVVDVHELADGGVGVFLRGGKGLVTKEFLNSAEVGAVGEEMSGESVAQGVGMQVPVDVDEANVFFDDSTDRAGGQTAPGVIEEHGFGVRSVAMTTAAVFGGVQEQFVA